MKVLITGGAGFIGSHIGEKLVALSHTVTVFDNLSSGTADNLAPGIELITGDICDHNTVTKLLKEHSFDAIFHLAAQINVRASVEDPINDAVTNILATLNLLEGAVKNKVKTFIFSSTGGVMYGDTEFRPTSENQKERPVCPYGIAKLAVDKYLHFYNHVYSIRTVSLRYGNVYGPRQNPHGEAGVVSIFLSKMLANDQPIINGDGNQTRDYVFIEDIVQANILALENSTAQGVYNIGTGKETSVTTLFTSLNSFFQNIFQETHGQGMPGEQKTSSLDSTRANTELNWSPKISLEEGLEKTFTWFRSKKG